MTMLLIRADFAKSYIAAHTLIKSHVKQFVRKDGAVVKEHEDKRTKKMAQAGPGRAGHRRKLNPVRRTATGITMLRRVTPSSSRPGTSRALARSRQSGRMA